MEDKAVSRRGHRPQLPERFFRFRKAGGAHCANNPHSSCPRDRAAHPPAKPMLVRPAFRPFFRPFQHGQGQVGTTAPRTPPCPQPGEKFTCPAAQFHTTPLGGSRPHPDFAARFTPPVAPSARIVKPAQRSQKVAPQHDPRSSGSILFNTLSPVLHHGVPHPPPHGPISAIKDTRAFRDAGSFLMPVSILAAQLRQSSR